jgi:hypothetical protein
MTNAIDLLNKVSCKIYRCVDNIFSYQHPYFQVLFFGGGGWRAPQEMLRTHRSLEAYSATLWWRWSVFSFFRVMKHRWNEIDRGKPKYSGKNLSQCHFVHHKSHMDWPRDRTRASAVRGRRLTAWAMARSFSFSFVIGYWKKRDFNISCIFIEHMLLYIFWNTYVKLW